MKPYVPPVTDADIAQQTAAKAYYETLRDHPRSTPEQRERAEHMLAKSGLFASAVPAEVEEFV